MGKLYITGKVIEQTLARTYVSIEGGAPSGKNMHLSKNGQTRGTKRLNMVFHIFVPISPQYIVLLNFQFAKFAKNASFRR